MASGLYKVILTGQLDGSRERTQIRDALVALFKLGEAEVDRLLDSAPVTIKSDLDYDTASKYKLAIEQTGALCELREIRDDDAQPEAAPAAPRPAAAPAAAAAPVVSGRSERAGAGPPPATRALSARRVDAGRGLGWWADGWRLFMESPGIWFAIGLIMTVLMIVLQVIPFIGLLAASLLPPLFTGGVMLGAHEQSAGRPLRVAHLFAGFSTRTGPLLALGGVYLLGTLIIGIVAAVLIGGAMLGGDFETGADLEDPTLLLGVFASTAGLLVILVAVGGGFVLIAALWLAPALVMIDDMPPLAAMRTSLVATLRNWLPFLVYGLLMTVFAILAVLPAGLGYLLLVPVVLASVYACYRDLFGQ